MDVTQYRAEFPVTGQYIFMNHAGVSALNRRAQAAMSTFLARSAELPIDLFRTELGTLAHDLKDRLAQLINASSAQEIVVMPNTATGINTAALSLPLRPGDNVLVVDGDYPANIYPWMNLAHRGVLTKVVPAVDGGIDLATLAARIDRRTRVVAVSAVMFASGVRNDLAAIGRLCREREIYFVVDGIQALGALSIDVQACHIDMLACGSQKWLLGPMGAGFLYCRHELLDHLVPGAYVGTMSVVDPWNFLDYNLTLQPSAERFSLGTPPVVTMHGLLASVTLIQEVGPAEIERHVLRLAGMLLEQLRAHGLCATPAGEQQRRSGIVIAEVDHPEQVHTRLLELGIAGAPRGRGVRFAPHFYNTEDEVERAVHALVSVVHG